MNNGLAVSVLDLVGMHTGDSPGSAIARSVDLARHVEALGYKRFWLAEHHSVEGLACSATSVLIGHVAGATTTIRVGSGGVMLPIGENATEIIHIRQTRMALSGTVHFFSDPAFNH